MYNATYHMFKPSGKFYSEGRGNTLPLNAYLSAKRTFQTMLDANNGTCPGLSTNGSRFNIVIIPDDDVDHTTLLSFPVMIPFSTIN